MTHSQNDLADLVGIAHQLADCARPVTLKYFRQGHLLHDNKAGPGAFDPVTVADREAETAMRAVLAKLRPLDGILGEEHAPVLGSSGLTWVLDPIDGTRSYISGAPSWGVLIGLDRGDGPILGVVDQPFTGERFSGHSGAALWQRGNQSRAMRVRDCKDVSEAILFTTFPEVGTADEGAAFNRVKARVRMTRYGLDCYAYMLLAMGEVDLVIEAGLKPYDIQGPQAVIEAAGGMVTDWQGGPAHMGGRVLAAGDRRMHAAAMEILAG